MVATPNGIDGAIPEIDDNLLGEEIQQALATKENSKCAKFKKVFGEFKSKLVEEKCIMVGIISNMATLMTFISAVQYGTLIFNQAYEDNTASQDYISDKLSVYFLISQLSVLIPAIGFGLIMDYIKVWKLVFLFHCLSLVSLVLFVIYTPTQEQVYNTLVH